MTGFKGRHHQKVLLVLLYSAKQGCGLTDPARRACAQALPGAVAPGGQQQRDGDADGEGGRLRGHEAATE